MAALIPPTPGRGSGGLPGMWRATVTRASPPYVQVPRLTGDDEVGPCETAHLQEPLAAGDKVWVGAIEGRAGQLVILARRGDTDTHAALWQAIDDLDRRITALGG